MGKIGEDHHSSNYSRPFIGIWLAMFVMLKVAIAWPWSWWWLLMPIVPSMAFVFTKLGWM